MQTQAQGRAEQAAELVADANRSRGIIGNLAVQPPAGSEHGQRASHSQLPTKGAGGKGRAPVTGRGRSAVAPNGFGPKPAGSKPAAPPNRPPLPPQ
jgi:hypothetical protein